MNYPYPHTALFRINLRNALRAAPHDSVILRVPKHKHIYDSGDEASFLYFIETGLVKLVRVSPEGKACLLAVLNAGDFFGELCLAGANQRTETAIAMQETILRKIPPRKFT